MRDNVNAEGLDFWVISGKTGGNFETHALTLHATEAGGLFTV